ncbi:MAG: hypothetical protein J7K29_03015 [Candidatus Cloacimonetes bacterium]|nr:hypothetical protein [Candidatus Cloacimonadota bacterium]
MQINFDKWKGKTAKIDTWHIFQRTTKLRPKPTWFCKLHTEVLEIVDGNEITASRLFQLRTPNSWSITSNLQKVLNHYKVKTIKELIGKEVIITVKENPKWLEWKVK